jgi:hypothetical protein
MTNVQMTNKNGHQSRHALNNQHTKPPTLSKKICMSHNQHFTHRHCTGYRVIKELRSLSKAERAV